MRRAGFSGAPPFFFPLPPSPQLPAAGRLSYGFGICPDTGVFPVGLPFYVVPDAAGCFCRYGILFPVVARHKKRERRQPSPHPGCHRIYRLFHSLEVW